MEEEEASKCIEPSWLDPSNDRKTPYSDAELDRLADTSAWRYLVADGGTQRAREIVKLRLAGRDPNSLVNWNPSGPEH
jgi:hypothetical protein